MSGILSDSDAQSYVDFVAAIHSSKGQHALFEADSSIVEIRLYVHI